MIYFDNAATTYPKPRVVREAMARALVEFGANPGRSGHAMSMRTADRIYRCRERAAAMFGLREPENVVFTLNCTHAINMVLHGVLNRGDHVVTSDLEHNAVMRPLFKLAADGVISYTTAHVCEGNVETTVENFKKAIKPNTRMIVCMHASNVFGTVLPIAEIAGLCHERGLLFVVDAAQSAGVLPLDMAKTGIDYLCMPGHKGLYGPMGTGLLLCADGEKIRPLLEGGTGNTPGIFALSAGIGFVQTIGIDEIAQHELSLIRELYDALAMTANVRLYTKRPAAGTHVPLLPFNIAGLHSEETAALLNEAGIAVRSGLHCAPCAHNAYGTSETGVVRLAPSYFTNKKEAYELIKSVRKIAKGQKT